MHGDGTRDRIGIRFIQMDPTTGNNNDPISLHKYLYAGANPVMYDDPSGHDFEIASLLGTIGIISVVQGGLAGGISAAFHHGTFWDGFARGVISTFVTDSLAVLLDAPSIIAIPVGNIASDIIVDGYAGNYNFHYPELAVPAIAHLIIDGVVGVVAGAGVAKWFPQIDEADSAAVFDILMTTSAGTAARNAITKLVIQMSLALSVQSLIAGGLDEAFDSIFDAIEGINHIAQNIHAKTNS
jgi:hypothetical protein